MTCLSQKIKKCRHFTVNKKMRVCFPDFELESAYYNYFDEDDSDSDDTDDNAALAVVGRKQDTSVLFRKVVKYSPPLSDKEISDDIGKACSSTKKGKRPVITSPSFLHKAVSYSPTGRTLKKGKQPLPPSQSVTNDEGGDTESVSDDEEDDIAPSQKSVPKSLTVAELSD